MAKINNVKIILCDLDGTLLNSDKIVTPRTIEAIQKVRDKGILFGIATGRTLAGVRYLVEDWGIKPYCDILMGFNGGMYIDYNLNKEGMSYMLSGEAVCAALEDYKQFDFNPGIFDGQVLHALKDNEIAHKIAKQNKLELAVDDLAKYKQVGCNKILGMAAPEVVNEMEAYSREHKATIYRCVRSTPVLFEFVNPELSKTKGIEIIAANHGCSLENVCVFGDELNDLEMIRDCGVGVCMKNGNPLVKEVANYVTGHNDKDGIADFIEAYLLD
ncbi:MAG: HAD family phosphatase [Erysipelotrichaceae bacterium]|nr:HAD family phosphatase [Erysipelotrichaceae bacterium]